MRTGRFRADALERVLVAVGPLQQPGQIAPQLLEEQDKGGLGREQGP